MEEIIEELIGKTIGHIEADESSLEITFDNGSIFKVDIGTFVGVEPFLDYELNQ